jgi:ferredoxin
MRASLMKVSLFISVLFFLMVYTGCSSPTEDAILSVDTKQCTGCSACFTVCEADAVRIIANKAVIDVSKCVKCGKCLEVCPENAIY